MQRTRGLSRHEVSPRTGLLIFGKKVRVRRGVIWIFFFYGMKRISGRDVCWTTGLVGGEGEGCFVCVCCGGMIEAPRGIVDH